ncbi:MAG: diacylglycerol kinase family protein [Pirellulaceae bacterium]
MPDDSKTVLLVANPKSGATESGARVRALQEAIQARGHVCELVHDLESVAPKSEQLQSQGLLKAVIAAGGDGTADALANRISEKIPLLMFPLGTENLLARHFGLKADIEATCSTLDEGRKIQIDAGSANGQKFLVMTSCGFDAEVVRQMHKIRKGHINRWSYTRPILTALKKYRFPALNIELDSETKMKLTDEPRQASLPVSAPTTLNAAWIFVFNLPMYAANLDFCPQADPADGKLDVCTFRAGGVLRGLGYFTRLFLRRHQSMTDFHHQLAERIQIHSGATSPSSSPGTTGQNAEEVENGIAFQIDGDPGGTLPLDIQVLPNHLSLLIPRA